LPLKTAGDRIVFNTGMGKILNWMEHQSSWLTVEWFMDALAPLLFGRLHWVKSNPENTTENPEYAQSVSLLGRIFAEHPDPKSVAELLARVHEHHYGSRLIDNKHLYEREVRDNIQRYATYPTVEQWESALLGEQDISEQLLSLPVGIALPLVYSMAAD
jgi:hypothetical protein